MQYVAIWDAILDSPKLMKLPADVFRFWVLSLVCAQKWDFVDGRLPDVERLTHWLRAPEDEVRRLLSELLAFGLIEPDGDDWKIHDWDDWRNVKDPGSTNRKRKSREAKRASEAKDATENVTVTDMSRVGHGSVTDRSRAGHGLVTSNPNPNPNPNPRPATPAPAREGAPASPPARPHAREASPEIIPIAPRPDPEWEPQPLPDESMTGRDGRDHADFVRAVQILDGHHSTRRLGMELRMHCDTPGVRMLRGWQLVVGAFAVQRPDRNRSWGTLTGFAGAAKEAEYEKLNAQAPARASPAASLPRLSDEELRAQTEEGNRKLAEYRRRNQT